MKTIISALALLLIASPVFAEVKIEIKSVELNQTKNNGKKWDIKIPLKKNSDLPDIYVEVKQGKKSILKTPVTKNSLTAVYTGQSVTVANAKNVTITVWDKDPARPDAAGSITITDQSGDVTLSGGGVKALKVSISGNKPAPAPAPAKAEPAPAPAPAKAEPAPAPAPAKAEPAPAPAPAKAEPAPAPAPAKAEPAKAEPAKAEPAKAEPAKAEPAKAAEPTPAAEPAQ